MDTDSLGRRDRSGAPVATVVARAPSAPRRSWQGPPCLHILIPLPLAMFSFMPEGAAKADDTDVALTAARVPATTTSRAATT